MRSNGETPKVPPIRRAAIDRTRPVAGLETVGYSISEASAISNTQPLYQSGSSGWWKLVI